MALIGKIAIAMAVNTKPLAAGLRSSAGLVTSFQAKLQKTGGAIQALFAGAAVYKAAQGIKSMVTTASDLNENMSKTQAIFGAGAKSVIASADQMAASFGVSKNEFLDAAAKMGGLFKGAGFSTDAVAQLSTDFTKLAADASSFYNLPFEQAFSKIRSGLSGESEPLKDLGILMNEDKVKAQALAMGLVKAGQELTDNAKVQARAALIAKGLADAQGDLARTADGVANRTRELSGRIENLAGTMGTALQPVAQSVLGEMSTAVSALSIAWEENQSQIVAWANQAIGGLGESAKGAGILQKSIGFIADAWDVMRLGFLAAQSYVMTGLAKIAEGLAHIVKNIESIANNKWLGVLAPELGALWNGLDGGMKKSIAESSSYFKTLGEDLHRLSDQEWKGFQDQLAKPWPHETVDEYFARAQKKIDALRKDAGKGGIDTSKIPTPAAGTGKAHEPKFASAMEAGSREAANTILRSRYGTGLNKGPAEATAKNTAKSAELLGKIAAAVATGAGPVRAAFGNF